jgi:hypothetical protein
LWAVGCAAKRSGRREEEVVGWDVIGHLRLLAVGCCHRSEVHALSPPLHGVDGTVHAASTNKTRRWRNAGGGKGGPGGGSRIILNLTRYHVTLRTGVAKPTASGIRTHHCFEKFSQPGVVTCKIWRRILFSPANSSSASSATERTMASISGTPSATEPILRTLRFV